MQITSENKTNFTSTPLRKIRFQTPGGKTYIDAVFSKLDPKDDVDIKAIKKLYKKFYNTKKDSTVESFCENFLDYPDEFSEYNAIELPQNGKKLHKRIIGFLQSYKNFDNYHLDYVCKVPGPKQPKGGIGDFLLGEVFKRAKETKSEFLEFISANDEYYFDKFHKVGIDCQKAPNSFDLASGDVRITSQDFDKYLDYIKTKYGENFSQKMEDGIKI